VAAGQSEASSNSAILFADGAEAGVAVGLRPLHAISAAADAKITANPFLEGVVIGRNPPHRYKGRFVSEFPDSKVTQAVV
jgi:hypothetical protein